MFLKKAIIISTILAVTSSVAFANAAPYVGAGLGITTNTSSSYGPNYRGVPFNVFAGFGGLLNQNFYLAGEFSGTLFNATIENNSFRTSYGFTGSIIPGLMLCDHTMLFARAGLGRLNFENRFSNMKSTGTLGLGMQTGLTQNIDVRGEYDYVTIFPLDTGKFHSDQATVSLIYQFN